MVRTRRGRAWDAPLETGESSHDHDAEASGAAASGAAASGAAASGAAASGAAASGAAASGAEASGAETSGADAPFGDYPPHHPDTFSPLLWTPHVRHRVSLASMEKKKKKREEEEEEEYRYSKYCISLAALCNYFHRRRITPETRDEQAVLR
ncbi:hypothetical protein FCM35_KLT02374 [Carex littledalei]|uniref:Uncharacterized protein n=1 Tax=Carex littledalei TaxID=544730 RepID=A0A833R743_9POAL|nr:hypothetical protein FCM35_KLT02374 [Carex littledalei]